MVVATRPRGPIGDRKETTGDLAKTGVIQFKTL